MFPEAVPIAAHCHDSCFLHLHPFLAHTNAIASFKTLVISRLDVSDFGPLTHVLTVVTNQQRRHSEPISGSRHQVCDNAFVRFPLVYLPELLCVIHFHADSILQNVLKQPFLKEGRILRVAPGNLDGC